MLVGAGAQPMMTIVAVIPTAVWTDARTQARTGQTGACPPTGIVAALMLMLWLGISSMVIWRRLAPG